MGVKDVDLCEKRQSEHPPCHIRPLFSEYLTAENDWRVYTGYELQELMNCIDNLEYSEPDKAYFYLQEAGITVHGLVQCKDSSESVKTEIIPDFTRTSYSSPVSGYNLTESASVEDDNQSKFKLVDDVAGQKGVKEVLVSELPARSVLESKPGRQEEKIWLQETNKPALCFDALRWIGTVVKWIIIYCAVFRVPGADATYLGIDSLLSIELHHYPVPNLSRSTWLSGIETIQKYKATVGNNSNQNLRISDQQIKNYELEIVQADGKTTLKRYTLTAFNSCAFAENEDLPAFVEGKKSLEVEISDGTVVVNYLLLMENQTLHVYFLKGTDRLLDLRHIQCNFTFETIDPVDSVLTANNSEKEMTTVKNGGKENSSDVLQILGCVSAPIAILVTICLVSYCVVKHLRRKRMLKNGINPQEQEHLSSGPAESPA